MKKYNWLIAFISIITLAVATEGCWAKAKSKSKDKSRNENSISAAMQQLRSLSAKSGQEEDYESLLERLTQDVWLIYGYGDTMAVRMDIVPRSVWDTVKTTDVKMHFNAEDLTNVTLKDSILILRPTQGEPLEYTSYQIGTPFEDCKTYKVDSYYYCGRNSTTNQWKIYSSFICGTAGACEFLYIDCQSGQVNNTMYGQAVLSPEGSKLCELFQNYHDGYNYIGIHQVKSDDVYYLNMDASTFQAVQAQWINDSTLKIKVELADGFGTLGLLDLPNAELFEQYTESLFYRILHITPFRVGKPTL